MLGGLTIQKHSYNEFPNPQLLAVMTDRAVIRLRRSGFQNVGSKISQCEPLRVLQVYDKETANC